MVQLIGGVNFDFFICLPMILVTYFMLRSSGLRAVELGALYSQHVSALLTKKKHGTCYKLSGNIIFLHAFVFLSGYFLRMHLPGKVTSVKSPRVQAKSFYATCRNKVVDLLCLVKARLRVV